MSIAAERAPGLLLYGLDDIVDELDRLVDRPEWMRDAACTEPHEGVHFIPPFHDRYEVSHAKEICAACLVRQECLNYALAADPVGVVGIWGGVYFTDRRRMRRATGLSAR